MQDPSSPVDRPHRPTDDSEEVYFEGSPLLRAELGRVLGFVAAAVGIVVLIGVWRYYRGELPVWWLTLGLLVVAVALAVWPVIMAKTIRYRITNYRIDISSGALSSNVDTLELWHVEDLRLHQSLVNRIMRVGAITVISHDDTTPTLLLRGIPRPRDLFTLLEQRVIAVKRQRGVLKMDSGQ